MRADILPGNRPEGLAVGSLDSLDHAGHAGGGSARSARGAASRAIGGSYPRRMALLVPAP
jgi:hypothetical protein